MKIGLAEPCHDAGIRRMLRETPIPGRIEVAYTREPDFFLGSGLAGAFNQTIVVTKDDSPVGIGCRSIRTQYVNGEPTDMGYLSSLRAASRKHGAAGLAPAYRFLRDLHQDGRAPVYTTTIVEDNHHAKALLTSRRAGLPRYIDHGLYETYMIGLNPRRRNRTSVAGVEVRRGVDVELSAIVSFLQREGARRQFFPVYQQSDFETDATRGFSPADFYVAFRKEQIVGVVGCWDQQAFKQNVIEAYRGGLKAARPVVNMLMRVRGYKGLPLPGEQIKLLYASFVCVSGDDALVLEALLERIHADRSGHAWHFLAIGFHGVDPLRAAVRHFFKIKYLSRLYVVCWDDGEGFCQNLDPRRVPYLELGAL